MHRTITGLAFMLAAANSYAAVTYTMSTDTSLFDASAMSQGTGDTLGMLPADNCENQEAELFRQNGDTTMLGDAYSVVWGTDSNVTPECPDGQEHVNYPIAINSSGAVVGRTASGPPHQSYLNPKPWIWTEADGFRAISSPNNSTFYVGGYVLSSGLSINDSGVVVGTGNGSCYLSAGDGYTLSAYIWTAREEARRLDQFIENLPPDTCIWQVSQINNLGQILGDAVTRVNGFGTPYPVVLLPDSDSDGVPDTSDNCTLAANPTQLDADGDGYGNKCDADLNNSGTVTTADYTILRNVLNQLSGSSPTAAAADLNGSGRVTTTDYTILRNALNAYPGPSGLHPNCPPTCP